MTNNVAESPIERSKRLSHEGVMAGAKAALIVGVATAIPTIAGARMFPWARVNHTAKALIVSTAAGAAYFIVADKTVLKSARQNSLQQPRGAAN